MAIAPASYNQIQSFSDAPYFGSSTINSPGSYSYDFVTMRTVTPSIRLSEIVEALYRFRDPIQVAGFLQEHRFLTDLLLEVYPNIRHYFGSDAELDLELYIDPEVPDFRKLFLIVDTPLPVERALQRLAEFDQWWIEVMPRARGKLSVDIE